MVFVILVVRVCAGFEFFSSLVYAHPFCQAYNIALSMDVFLYRPELFSVLAQQLQSADVLSSYRIFLTLLRILKELSSKRLASDQKNLAEVCASL